MLRIITGRAKSGKSEICSREFAEHVAAGIDHGAYFIVPEQFTVEAEQRILSLAVMKDKSLFEAEVLSFKRLIHRVLSRLGGGTGNVLSRSGRAMLLISSLSALSGELVWFKDMQQKPAMVLAMLKLIDELETYNSDRSALEQKLSALAETDEKGVSPKYKDLLLIYREFSRRMSEAYSSVGDACDRAIREADEAGFFKGAEIWIDEFTGFTDPELRIIECMLKSGADVTVSLCTSREQEPVFKAVDRTLDRLFLCFPKDRINQRTCQGGAHGGKLGTLLVQLERSFEGEALSPALKYPGYLLETGHSLLKIHFLLAFLCGHFHRSPLSSRISGYFIYRVYRRPCLTVGEPQRHPVAGSEPR